jgi:radical SAM/Cys-rich protein
MGRTTPSPLPRARHDCFAPRLTSLKKLHPYPRTVPFITLKAKRSHRNQFIWKITPETDTFPTTERRALALFAGKSRCRCGSGQKHRLAHTDDMTPQSTTIPAFKETLDRHGLELSHGRTTTLQINVGLACDLACRHCHLEAGPNRTEMMSLDTAEAVIACAGRIPFDTIDITGGAPELQMHLPMLVGELAPLTRKLIVRTNLVALLRPEHEHLPLLYRKHRVALVASLPATNASQTDAQRGNGVWEQSIAVIRRLNELGYGVGGSGLELDLVANPSGAFLPAAQAQAEPKFRKDLKRRFGITFSTLYTFANVPLGRFRTWLESSGNLDGYLHTLAESFNPCTIPGLMCRSQIAVDWSGRLYDCDFNLAAGLHHGEQRMHVSELHEPPAPGTAIPVGEHCYACTAGSGFT